MENAKNLPVVINHMVALGQETVGVLTQKYSFWLIEAMLYYK